MVNGAQMGERYLLGVGQCLVYLAHAGMREQRGRLSMFRGDNVEHKYGIISR